LPRAANSGLACADGVWSKPMPIFPKIQSPCPYKGPLADILEGDMCRLCHREVIDLDPFTDAERIAFLAGCKTQVCVSFKLRPAIAAAITAATLGAPLSAAAEEGDVEAILVVGGMIEPANVELISTDDALPELDVILEGEATEAPPIEDPPPQDEPASGD
jgi:hypothetical protein